MYSPKKNNQPSVFGLVRTAVGFTLIAVYTMISMNTEDLLWFWPVFDAQPQRVTVFCYGEEVTLQPGTAEFEELTAIFNQEFSGYKNWDSLTMSETSWADYQSNAAFATLIFHYPEPVRVHSIYKYFSGVDTLVVPLDGRHAASHAVFGVTNEVPGSGSLHIQTLQPMVNMLTNSGVCAIQ